MRYPFGVCVLTRVRGGLTPDVPPCSLPSDVRGGSSPGLSEQLHETALSIGLALPGALTQISSVTVVSAKGKGPSGSPGDEPENEVFSSPLLPAQPSPHGHQQ